MTKKLLIITLLFVTVAAQAHERKKYSVTGKSGSVNAFYYEMIECAIATDDAKSRATDLCYDKGFNYYTHETYGRCKSRLFGGKRIKLTFYCE